MNIKQAKNYIKNTVNLYLKKDNLGEYRIPVVRQRPVFLLGAPGIGKTAIMEQIAQELGIALVSYSMTHHTRQSALGLPYIAEKNYGGNVRNISEYTMSEIIASLYDTMEAGGMEEGILFLDEINCVSETLASAMLQFLQYKTFGRHKVPPGWVIVTAGNPPEYNRSVREFDVATMDRLKIMEVEPDYGVWKEYAAGKHIHGAVTGYLDLKKDHFYKMEMTPGGWGYVTARGWEDLSEILLLHEEEQLPVDEALVGQYLRNEGIVREFTAYYELYQKYRRDYGISSILEGEPSPGILEKARKAPFDERISLMGILLDSVETQMQSVMEQAAFLTDLKNCLTSLGGKPQREVLPGLEEMIFGRRQLLERLRNANSLSDENRKKHSAVIGFLEKGIRESRECGNWEGVYSHLKQMYHDRILELKRETDLTKSRLHALFVFTERAFGQGNEMLVLVTELTGNTYGARFLAAFGSDDYAKYSEAMMLSERRNELLGQIEAELLKSD